MKKLIPLVLLLLMTSAALARPVKAQATTIAIEPAEITDMEPGETKLVSISVDIGTNELFMWVLNISWNPEVLNLTVDPIEGPFVKNQVGATLFTSEVINQEEGHIDGLMCGSMTGEIATGSGVIAMLNFTALPLADSSATSVLDLYAPPGAVQTESPIWVTIGGDEYAFDTVTDGSITVIPEFPAFLILPLFMLITLVAVLITLRSKKRRRHLSVQ